MRCSRAGLALSLEGQTHPSLAADFEGERDTIEHAQLRSERPDGAQQSPFGDGETVRVVLSRTRRTGTGQVLEQQLSGLQPSHEERSQVPCGGCEPIPLLQRPGATDRRCLLAETAEQVPDNLSLVEESCEALLEGTCEVEVPV